MEGFFPPAVFVSPFSFFLFLRCLGGFFLLDQSVRLADVVHPTLASALENFQAEERSSAHKKIFSPTKTSHEDQSLVVSETYKHTSLRPLYLILPDCR